MNKHKLNVLSNELGQAGADDAEVAVLLELADQLGLLKHGPPVPDHPPRLPRSLWRLSLACTTVLAIGLCLTVFAQTSLPGSWLYPVKRLSEQAAIAVHPGYRSTVMMHRAQEVQRLVARHADAHTVLATLADYRTDAAAYKSQTESYSALEHCKSSLEQAKVSARGQERRAIESTLASLQTV